MTITKIQPKINIIAALTRNFVIGQAGGKLLWHLPADFARFKRQTMGHPIIMGRKTFQSIGHALPGRTNIVLSRNPLFTAKDVMVARSLENAFELVKPSDEIYVIGGSEVFAEALPKATVMHLTWVESDVKGDVYFPQFDDSEWLLVVSEKLEADEANIFPMTFCTCVRKKN